MNELDLMRQLLAQADNYVKEVERTSGKGSSEHLIAVYFRGIFNPLDKFLCRGNDERKIQS